MLCLVLGKLGLAVVGPGYCHAILGSGMVSRAQQSSGIGYTGVAPKTSGNHDPLCLSSPTEQHLSAQCGWGPPALSHTSRGASWPYVLFPALGSTGFKVWMKQN
jgi:hypothetical protein